MEDTAPSQARVLLSVQRALLGAIRPEVRAVACGWSDRSIRLRFLFDGPISPAAAEDMRTVGTEVIADFGPSVTVEEEIQRADYPGDLQAYALDAWAYRRKEEPGS